MVDFEKMVGGNALKHRLSAGIQTVAGFDVQIEALKAQRKEALATIENDDKLDPKAVAYLAYLHRTGKSDRVTSSQWPIVERYAKELGIVLPGADQLDLFGEDE